METLLYSTMAAEMNLRLAKGGFTGGNERNFPLLLGSVITRKHLLWLVN